MSKKYLDEDGLVELVSQTKKYVNNKSGVAPVYITKEQYDELPDSKYTDNIEYRITDWSDTSFNIIDNLKTDSSIDALSAKQGKILDEKISFLSNSLANVDSTSYKTVTYGPAVTMLNTTDQVRCYKMNNGMRCITGALQVTSSFDANQLIFSVPNEFAINITYGFTNQKWISLCNASSGKNINALFSGNNISLWGNSVHWPQTGDILSIHIIY